MTDSATSSRSRLSRVLGQRPGAVPALLCLAALVAAQQLSSIGGEDLLGRTLNNSLHIPLFAAVAWLLGRLLPAAGPLTLLAAALGLGAATEAAQVLTARDASLMDLGLDLLGAAPVVAALAASRRLARQGAPRRRVVLLWSATVMLVAAMTLAAPARVLLAYQARDQAFPVILDPAVTPGSPLFESNSQLRGVAAPAGWAGDDGPVLAVTWADTRYPGITIAEVTGDWQEYQALVVEMLVPPGPPASLTVALGYRGRPGTSAYLRRDAGPGFHRLVYPLADFAPAVVAGQARVDRLILHTGQEHAGRRVVLGRVRLERTAGPGSG